MRMAFQFNNSDQGILLSIAEHRILTVYHLTTLHRRNANALRRRLKILRDEGLIQIDSQPFGRGRGRPESLVSLCEAGVELLKIGKLIDSSLPADKVTAQNMRGVDHELLVNDFRTQLVKMEQIVPALSIRFYSANSPRLAHGSNDRPFVHERVDSADGSYDGTEFVPDGVLAITHTELGKTLRFFLEADRGTEPRNSTRHNRRGIRQRILNYQRYFAIERYKRYERILTCELRGFRLLILTEDRARFAALAQGQGIARLNLLGRQREESFSPVDGKQLPQPRQPRRLGLILKRFPAQVPGRCESDFWHSSCSRLPPRRSPPFDESVDLRLGSLNLTGVGRGLHQVPVGIEDIERDWRCRRPSGGQRHGHPATSGGVRCSVTDSPVLRDAPSPGFV
ncbi:MAG: replication-relaxation family protein [Planctomycetes bacterium]|nr:replication-relaxation family protein [Planctomycetota bacterium]